MKKFSLLLVLIILILTATGCRKQVFDGSRTSNEKQFILDYAILSKSMTHEMELEQGAVIDVVIVNKSGQVDILVTDESGKELYRGDNASSSEFSIEIPEKGTYKFMVIGKKAKGGVSFILEE